MSLSRFGAPPPTSVSPAAWAAETAEHTITGFIDSPVSICYSVSQKPSESEVIKKMPDALDVYLDGNSEIVTIPVL